MKIHLLSGFLGSGKTTAIQQACKTLIEQEKRVAVVTNDQGIKLVDSLFFNSLDVPNRQVINGCFCCNYNDLDSSIQSLMEEYNPEVIFAESVGSCTDIVATVLKPLRLYRPDAEVTISVFADVRLLHLLLIGVLPVFDDTVNYIYYKQLYEAAIIVVNKTGLIEAEKLDEVKQLMDEKYAGKKIIYQDSLNASGVKEWLDVLETYPVKESLSSLEINYDIYGEGEAKLAWLDEELEIESLQQNAVKCTTDLINSIYKKIRKAALPVGHLKFLVNGKVKISFTSTSETDEEINAAEETGQYASLLINARVQTKPAVLAQVIEDAISETEAQTGCNITTGSMDSFQPGYPTPVHRIND